MRVLVFFDLPVLTDKDRSEYRKFRKFLIKSGFLMEQESVYCKLTQNSSVADAVVANVRKNKPDKGLVEVLRITEKQYNKIEFVVGTRATEILNSDERLVIL